jgi:hypothetical protein
MTKIPEEIKQRALAMHAGGMKKLHIARVLGVSESGLREIYDPTCRERRRQNDRNRRRTTCRYVLPLDVPEDVLNERDNAYSAQISVGALLFGDPRPGRSALDRRNGG